MKKTIIITIILLLAGLLYLFIPYQPREKLIVQTLKANMHTVQMMLDIYGWEHNAYPTNFKSLKKEAIKSRYWKRFSNPYQKNKLFAVDADVVLRFAKKHTIEEAFSKSIFSYLFFQPEAKPFEGCVIYDYVDKNSYYLYGVSRDNRLEQKEGKIFVLSNAY